MTQAENMVATTSGPRAGNRANTDAVLGLGLALVSIFLFWLPAFGPLISVCAITGSIVGLVKHKAGEAKYLAFALIGLIVGVLTLLAGFLWMIYSA